MLNKLRDRWLRNSDPNLSRGPRRLARCPALRVETLEDRRLLTGGLTLQPIADQTLLAGAPLQVPINATDSGGHSVTYSVSSNNGALVTALPTTNPDLVLNVTHTSSGQAGDTSFSGQMIIELFQSLAPNTVAQIISLTNQGFYNGVVFNRVASDGGSPFVIQAGIATAQDSSITVPQINNELAAELRYSSVGVVGMARTTADDTNNSQFFITAADEPFLDYQYTIFGRLVSGENVRAEIQSVPVDANSVPDSPVTITSASIINDTNDLALEVSAALGTTTSGTVTVTASDGFGGTDQQSFNVNVSPDPNDPGPFLQSITAPTTTVNTPVSFQLPAFDLEGDPLTYYDATGLQSSFNLSPTQPINANLQVSVNSSTGAVTVTPTNGLVGVTPMFFGVSSSSATSPLNGEPSTRMVPLFIDPAAPTSVTLAASSQTGGANTTALNNSDSNHTVQFVVSGVLAGATVELFDGSQQIGSAVASSTSVTVTTDGVHALSNGQHQITAQQVLQNQNYTVGNSSGTVNLPSQSSSAFALNVNNTLVTAADLAVAIVASSGLSLAGGTVSYKVTVTNLGPNAAQGVTLTDTLPATTTFATQTQNSGPGFSLSNNGNTINDAISSLAAGASATFTIVAKIGVNTASGTVISDTASVGTASTDSNSANNSGSATTTVISTGAMLVTDPYNAAQNDLVVTGTTGADNISFTMPTPGKISVTLNGKTSGPFAVTGRLVAFGVAGNDAITVGPAITLPSVLYAGTGNSTVTGGSGSNVIVGGGGADTLIGGSGRNLIIAGAGPSKLYSSKLGVQVGLAGGSILIGGTTDFDSNDAALHAIISEWASADAYATRVAKIKAGTTLTGAALTTTTIHKSAAVDQLYASLGYDWFLAPSALDQLIGLDPTKKLLLKIN